MKNNKKGFTLLELLAVTVILIVVMLIAINAVRESTKKSHMNSFKAGANSFLNNLRDVLGEDIIDEEKFDDGIYNVNDLYNMGIKVSGNKPTGGYVFIFDNTYTKYCLEFEDTYYLSGTPNNMSDAVTGKCDMAVDADNIEYTGSEEVYTVAKSGIYLLEVWGAQGGSLNSDYPGGYGGYARGLITLNKNDKLYINVGGKGVDKSAIVNGFNTGGYNGGGKSYAGTTSCSNYSGSGGGATSIALSTGLLKEVPKEDLVIVAGGGGGSLYRYCSANDYDYSSGGSGGGLNGNVPENYLTVWTVTMGTGGSQIAGGVHVQVNTESGGVDGSFGQGGETSRTGGYTNMAGGGGGYYGGGNGVFLGATGGSGYINKTLLKDYSFSSYSSDTSSSEHTTCFNNNPVAKCAKAKNGHARILLIQATGD